MKLFSLFGKREYDVDDYDEDDYEEELENFQDFLYEAPENNSQKQRKNANSNIDFAEEAKLDQQLNEHLNNIELKKQYEKAIKERQTEKIEHINVSKYSKSDIEKFIKSQCDILNETSKYIEEAKNEYTVVTSYFSDIQLIESAPETLKKNMTKLAETISNLSVDRRIFRSSERKISNNTYTIMERIEPEMPGALIQMQNYESYFQTVKNDVKILEGEQKALRYDARDLIKKQKNIRMVSLLSILSFVLVFIIFIALTLVSEEESNYLFLTVIGLAAMFAGGLFAYLKNIERQVEVTEIKLNKATNLLNKAKIKYINGANTLDYSYSKYSVKSSYQLSRQFEAYLEEKRQKEKLSKLTDDLNSAEVKLELILKGLQLYDPHIWLAQVKALVNPKEMVEVRHGLSIRRQKLRMQIEYNMNRVEEVKQEIKGLTISNPEFTDEVLRIIENYERDL